MNVINRIRLVSCQGGIVFQFLAPIIHEYIMSWASFGFGRRLSDWLARRRSSHDMSACTRFPGFMVGPVRLGPTKAIPTIAFSPIFSLLSWVPPSHFLHGSHALISYFPDGWLSHLGTVYLSRAVRLSNQQSQSRRVMLWLRMVCPSHNKIDRGSNAA